MAVTIKDVAERAGVSIATVSRVINKISRSIIKRNIIKWQSIIIAHFLIVII